MKHIIKLTSIVLFAFTFWSCEEIIDINLNESNPKVVIEALIEEDSVCRVSISLTKSMFDIEETIHINNAIITLNSSNGESEILNFIDIGTYKGSTIIGTQGINYSISVEIDGETYEAQTYLPYVVPIKDIVLIPQSNPHGDTGFVIQCLLDDPINLENFYRINYEKLNNLEEPKEDYSLFSDYLSDGEEISGVIFSFDFEENDSLEINLLSIDRSTYSYFYQLTDILSSGMGNSSTPYNPDSNFSNNCLGYFGSYSTDTRRILLTTY